MKILFCSQSTPTAIRGGAKVVVELAEEMQFQGWDCALRGPEEICPNWATIPQTERLDAYTDALRLFLQKHAADYDVVDYPYEHLPFPREEFPLRPVFVARSVLLNLHFQRIQIPPYPHWRSKIGAILLKKHRAKRLADLVQTSVTTFQQADLANVSSERDKAELLSRGIAKEKILALPYGISRERRPLFDAISPVTPPIPVVTFVGTVDARKGINDLPRIFSTIATQIPQVQFLMLGGGSKSVEQILAYFPRKLHPRIKVQPNYAPAELPGILSQSTLGVFPSHVEGFPFGVLEMLAAAAPVIAYDAPGPSAMLTSEYLVPRGDWATLASKVTDLLLHPDKLATARQWAQERSRQFSWENAAAETIEIYAQRVEQRRQRYSPHD